jgi:hypothetical protein
MKTTWFTACLALTFLACGPDIEEQQAGMLVQPMVAEEHQPPIKLGPTRLSNEELFKDTAPLVVSPQDPTLADQVPWTVDRPPCP